MSNPQVIGGQLNFPMLTNKVPPFLYEITKMKLWSFLLSEGKRPKRWLKPTKEGTKVNFDIMRTREEVDEAIKELNDYLEAKKQVIKSTEADKEFLQSWKDKKQR